MAVRLGELLIHNKLLSKEQLEEALQAQVIFGGKLGTILIEMGLISENLLAQALSKLLKIPCAKPGELQNVPENVVRILSPELAEKYQAMPMALKGRNLTMAMANPHDLKAIDDIAFRTGYIIRPVLGLEVRLVFALEKYYGIKRTIRYIAPPQQVRQELDQLNRPIKTPEKTEEEEYLGEPGSEHIYPPQQQTSTSLAKTPAQDDDDVEDLVEEDVTLQDICQSLVEVRSRDDVAEAVIRYLATRFHRAALFMVVGGQITGWRSAKAGQPIAGFDAFQLPTSEPSVLKTAIDSRSYFLGPIPGSGANLALTSHLGKPVPASALLLPLVLMGRVVALFYVDDPDRSLAEHLPELQTLATRALLAFELLILHNKILRT